MSCESYEFDMSKIDDPRYVIHQVDYRYNVDVEFKSRVDWIVKHLYKIRIPFTTKARTDVAVILFINDLIREESQYGNLRKYNEFARDNANSYIKVIMGRQDSESH